jgi:hypothetical protein
LGGGSKWESLWFPGGACYKIHTEVFIQVLLNRQEMEEEEEEEEE